MARNIWISGKEAETFLVAGLIFILYIYSVRAASLYLPLSNLINSPTLINPPIKFVIGAATANVTGMVQVPLNQTFCPESRSVIQAVAASNKFQYYTTAGVGQSFRYSLMYNSSLYGFAYAVVLPPFSLVSFSNVVQTSSNCAGYPNTLGNATIIVQAPGSSYFGPIYAILYFSKK